MLMPKGFFLWMRRGLWVRQVLRGLRDPRAILVVPVRLAPRAPQVRRGRPVRQVRKVLPEPQALQGLRDVVCGDGLMTGAFERVLEDQPDRWFVIETENRCHRMI